MSDVAASHGVTAPTACKWLGRYLAGAGGTAALVRVIPASVLTVRYRRGQGAVDRGVAPATHAAKADRT
uniref:Uncharacterized protein n=1 Tax=Ralstonia solanacearum CFBP2957 TaxID=859656 RepID=D8P777_RALSL|nr:protein of unknown function [Ralstonia solanacearum CFBP2957]